MPCRLRDLQMPAHLGQLLARREQLVSLGELADDLIRRMPPALVRCHVVVDSSCPNTRATESHNDWTTTEGSPHVDVARTYTRAAVDRIIAGDTDVRMVSMAKNQAVEACALAVDTAVQLYGGMGYLRETEVEMHYRDSRILGIGGGTTEIMKEIIAKRIGL